MVNVFVFHSLIFTLVSDALALKLFTPSESIAPSGISFISINKLSEPSLSVSAALISKEIAVSSSPTACSTFKTGELAALSTLLFSLDSAPGEFEEPKLTDSSPLTKFVV